VVYHYYYYTHTHTQVRFEEVMQLSTEGVDQRHMQVRGKLMIQGIQLAHGVGNLLRNFLNTHMSLEVGMAKRCLKPVCRAMEILKGIESMFRRKTIVIAQSMKHIMRVYELKILDILESLRKKLRSTKQSDLTLDLIAALRVVETTFHGTESLSFTRLMLSSLCFDVCSSSSSCLLSLILCIEEFSHANLKLNIFTHRYSL